MKEKMFEVGATFGIPAPKGVTIQGFEKDANAPGAHLVPNVDPNYIFRPELLRDVLGWWKMSWESEMSDSFMAFGPQGSGKSSLIAQVAARLNIPVIRVTGHGRLEVGDLLGSNTVLGGDIMFADGPLTTAARIGAWFVMEEGDALDPSTQIGLNTITEGGSITIPETGEVVAPHKNFRFLVTGNTNLGGDQTGLFQGTQRQNIAFADRFFMTEVGYPTPEMEEKVLEVTAPQLAEPIRKGMIEFANMVRKLFLGNDVPNSPVEPGSLDITLSTRTLMRWAKLTWFFQGTPVPVAYALDRAFGFKADPDTRTVLHELAQRVFGKEGA